MNIYFSLFGVLWVLTGLNLLFYRRWWAENAFKRTPLFKENFWMIFFIIMGLITIVAGLGMITWGFFGGPGGNISS